MSRLLLSLTAAVALAAPVAAHHETPGKSHAVATVTIPEQVQASGKPLAPGTYEIWILDERPQVAGVEGTPAQRVVEFVQNGKPVAREIAEVFTAGEEEFLGPDESHPGATGTSGAASSTMSKAVVQRLRSGEFLRIAITGGGARYLIHLPTKEFSAAPPQPQSPSRIELPPQPAAPAAPPQPVR